MMHPEFFPDRAKRWFLLVGEHTALGTMACSPIDGEQGLGDIRIYKKRREVFGWKCRDGLAGLRGGRPQPQW
jgi:hypothetical protein